MRRLFASIGLALLLAARGAPAQGLAIDWSRTAVSGGRVLPGEGPGGATALQLEATAPAGTTFHLVTIDEPRVPTPAYAIAGEVRYEGVEGQGYLEMWSVFPDGQRFFSRTIAAAGTLAALHGDGGWRRFELPFMVDGAAAPTRLEINLVLPGRGTVWLGPLHLGPYAAGTSGALGGWWTMRAGGLIGGLLGGGFGLVGALIGVLTSLGKARRLVLGMLWAMAVIGGASLVTGAAALWIDQPRHVWYPLLLIGVVVGILGLTLRRTVKRRFADLELRRMQAMDAGGPR